MSGIQSSIGLITGIPIQETVDQLIAVSARTRDSLVSRTARLQSQQVATTELTALVIGVQLATDQLGKIDLFSQTKVTSSASDQIAARATGSARPGRYQFIPVRQASQQQVTSSFLSSSDQKVGSGQVVIHSGGFVDSSLDLDQANGGSGVSRGFITITDRSGAQQNIDLRFAQNAADVVDAVNASTGIRVTARIDGDRFALADVSGGTISNLRVSEVGTGTTAADLGLASINTSSTTANGSDIVILSNSTSLRSLLDNRGIQFASTGPSLKFDFQDGSTVNFTSTLDPKTASLGQLIEELNAASGGKLQVGISASGDSLDVADLTTGASAFAISSPTGSLAKQLGWEDASVGGVNTGSRLRAGLGGVLLASLNGGAGLGTLGQVTITDRSGASATVDLASATTLNQVIDAINATAIGVTAQLNDLRTGISILDTTGSTSGSLIVASADATTTAEKLGISGNVASHRIAGNSLKLQWVTEQTLLRDYNQGKGVPLGSFTITDSVGISATVNLASADPKTIGDVIEKINSLSIGVEARLNESGDGLLLIDTASGSGSLTVTDDNGGQTAKLLGIAGTGASLTVGGNPVVGIDGTRTQVVTATSDTTVQHLVEAINALDGSANASVLNLGSQGGVRLTLSSNASGQRGRFAIDASALALSFSQSSSARDALLSLGGSESGGGIVLSSSTDTFSDIIDGVELQVAKASTSSVTVEVTENSSEIGKKLKAVVDQFNKVRDKISTLTSFDPVKFTTGLLFGSGEVLRVDMAFGRLFSGRISGAGSVRSIAELGVSFRDDGKLEFDEVKLSAALAKDPAAVKEFFTKASTGFSAKAKELIDTLTGVNNGALISKNNTLQIKIDQNNSRIANFNLKLDRERTRLLTQFYKMEETISKLQNNQSAIGQLQQLANYVRA